VLNLDQISLGFILHPERERYLKKMIITISGDAGSGKSTCARGVAKKTGLKRYSMGDLMRQIAIERKLSLEQLSCIAETDSSIDKELDQKQRHLGASEDEFIIDGRLSAYFIPQAIKVFLVADIDECARRIFLEKRSTEFSQTVQSAREKLLRRKESEIKRYLEYYRFDPYDTKYYDVVFDTSNHSIDETLTAVYDSITKIQRAQP
jgi:cytidylate kinase